MTTTQAEPAPPVPPTEEAPQRVTRAGDSIFRGLATGAGLMIMLALAGVAIFLVLQSIPAIGASGDQAYGADNIVVYIWPLLFGTILAAVIALIIATPLAIGVALVISHYAPRRIARLLGYLIDLLVGVDHLLEEKEMGGIRVVPGGVERRGAHRGDPGQLVVEAQFPLVGTPPPGRCEAALP